jgi:nucleotide-binding universal stress UspA family protein
MFAHIVCAVDGSDHAALALDYAFRLAQRDSAELHVAHVVERILAGRVAGQTLRLDEEQLIARIASQLEAGTSRYGITPALHRAPGTPANPAQQITQIASSVGADLIVIGTRGHSALAGAILGSVTQRLLHIAPCPVLAVPPPRAAGGVEIADAAQAEG